VNSLRPIGRCRQVRGKTIVRVGTSSSAIFFAESPRPGLLISTMSFILEPVVRYSGVNQRAIVTNEITTTPSVGFNGSPSIFTPHAREVALGLNYWIEPSIVLQTEFDLELPRAGGTGFTFNQAQALLSHPAPSPNDRALLTQLSIGF
jgi:hypothetical protein